MAEFMFQNVVYRATVYRTGERAEVRKMQMHFAVHWYEFKLPLKMALLSRGVGSCNISGNSDLKQNI